MLEVAETSPTVSAEDYRQLEPQLRTQLIQMQQSLRTAKFPVLVIVSGDDAGGVRSLVNLMSEWMDPRFVVTRVFSSPTADEKVHPPAWRYWRELPANGRIGVFSDDWTTSVLAARLGGRLRSRQYGEVIDACARFERMLVLDGAVIVKLYVHLAQDQLRKQRKRLRRDAGTSCVAMVGKNLLKYPRKARRVIEEVLERTNIAGSCWNLIDGSCKRYRDVTAVRALLEAVKTRSEQAPAPAEVAPMPSAAPSVLDSVDLSATISADQYELRMSELKSELGQLSQRARKKGISVVAGFEGWDAAGKGGTIRRVAYAMNPENYRIVPIAAPTDEEKAHHYLWRFWRHIPPRGGFVIFDRTWYGRVLVERVEGFATPQEWGRAYEEINYLEQRLAADDLIVLKFWLHIDRDEQLRRFQDRENTPYKAFKIGPDDYRNREKWDAYVLAINDMVARTSTPHAPWHLISSNDKKYARVEVMGCVVDALKARL